MSVQAETQTRTQTTGAVQSRTNGLGRQNRVPNDRDPISAAVGLSGSLVTADTRQRMPFSPNKV